MKLANNIIIPMWIDVVDYLSLYENKNLNIHRFTYKYKWTDSHILEILRSLEKMGFVKTEKIGRQRMTEFTKRGQELAATINKLKAQLNDGVR